MAMPKADRKASARKKAPPKAKPVKAKLVKARPAPATEVDGEPKARHPGGRPSKYKPEYAQIARVMCSMGACDAQLADAFETSMPTIWNWQSLFPEFAEALKIHKGEYDERVKRSLAQRAVGYSYDAVKIFPNNGNPISVAYREHVPPDPGAAKIWLSNRQPDEWREKVALTGQDGNVLEIRIVA